MANILVISDTHFGQRSIIGYCARPFPSVEAMDEAIVERWNAIVRPRDHVYHLGDVAMKVQAMDAILPRLNGKKRLIRGNHDIFPTKRYLRHFQEIHGMRVLDTMLFTHIPIHPESMGRFWANVHGHMHEKQSYGPRYLNVSVEQTDYRPISLEDVKRRIEDQIQAWNGDYDPPAYIEAEAAR